MRDLIKKAIICTVMSLAPQVFAEDYKVMVLPDNIVTENAAIDSYIYNATAEFFAEEITSLLNETDYIKCPTVSQTRATLKKDPSTMLPAKSLTDRFRTSYNVDYNTLNKLGTATDNRYVLLLTSSIDAQNFILRRTWWDFFNVPGASVVDPAYKISTFAVLIDTKNNKKLWSDTYYKTISTVENRIITQGPSPQSIQLEKIKDYSRYVCPQIAQQVQLAVLPENIYLRESKHIEYDFGNIDNIFTKKYRHYGEGTCNFFSKKKENFNIRKAKRAEKKAIKEAEKRAKLEVQAKPVYNDDLNKINNKSTQNDNSVKNAVYKQSDLNSKPINYYETQSDFDSIEIKKNRKNNLYGGYDSDKLPLRDYYK